MSIEYQLLGGGDVIAFNDYYAAREEAERQDLLLAEYGALYGRDMAYAYWNKTGDRNDGEVVIAYYKFNSKGRPEPLSKEEFESYIHN